jgi:hypothetical protein
MFYDKQFERAQQLYDQQEPPHEDENLITGELTQDQWLLISSAITQVMYNQFVGPVTKQQFQELYDEMKNQKIWF